MSNETSKNTPGAVGDRSAPAEAGVQREATAPGVGRASDPEVAAVAKRRKHSTEYKWRILDEIDEHPGQSGMVLRREGLYSSSLSQWRKERDRMNTPKKPTTENKRLHNELAKAKRRNARLELQLKKAEGIIELQKKASELLKLMSQSVSEDDS